MSGDSKEHGQSRSAETRKRSRGTAPDAPSLEIDLEAPEPPSKKRLRKAKRTQASQPANGPLNHEDFEKPVSSHARRRNSPTFEDRKASGGRSGHGIWIGNLPFFITKNDLQAFLSKSIGETTKAAPLLTRIHLPRAAPKHGVPQNKGFAYVDFHNVETLRKALGLNESLLGGRRLLIKDAGDFQGRPTGELTPDIQSSKRLFVGNLTFETTTEALQHHFEKCGPVSSVHVATFEDSGKCKGYAWVDFEDIASARKAMRGYVESHEFAEKASDEESHEFAEKASDEEPHVEDAKKEAVKPGRKRIWINRLDNRQLRLEFAEDPATRYSKRFGKEAQEKAFKDKKSSTEDRPLPDEAAAQAPSKRKDDSGGVSRKGRRTSTGSRHSQDVVEKLKGIIVHSQGTKTKLE